MAKIPELIRFDWAMKRLLRDKANFEVLEGFLTTLLEQEIKIDAILESESNQDHPDMKYNRVDLVAQGVSGEKYLIEVQNQSEIAYFHRILFGTSRLISDYQKLGDDYGKISKIYSINIVYFNLGEGTDSVYVGKTEFIGLHDKSVLGLSARWKKELGVETVSGIFPTYYVLRVNDFDRWSKTPLDQWLYFLSKGRLSEEPTAPGLKAVEEKLRVDSMSESEQLSYRKKLDDLRSILNGYNDALRQGRDEGREEGLEEGRQEGLKEGREEGLKEGREEGLKEGRQEGLKEGRQEGLKEGRQEAIRLVVENMVKAGLSTVLIAQSTGLSAGEVEAIAAGCVD